METLSTIQYKTFGIVNALQKKQTVLLALVFCLSLAARFHEYYFFREMNSDKARQLQGAYELLHGHGVSYKSYDLKTFQPAYVPIVEWPPAYSFLVAGVSFFTGGDVYKASFVLDGLALTGLWLCLLWLTSLLRFGLMPRCVLFLFLGVSKPPLNAILSSDLLGTVVFLAACGLALWHVSTPPQGRKPVAFFTGQAVCLFLMVSLKYSLLPACVAVGASFLLYSFFSKEKFYKTGLALLGIFGLCLFVVFLYNHIISGRVNVMHNRYLSQERSLQFSNLSLFNPFIVATFFHLDLLYQRFFIPAVHAAALALTAALFAVISISIVQKMRRTEARFFDYFVFTVSFSVIAFLSALSVYLPRDVHPTHEWTYVKDFRYFSPAVFMVLLYLLKNFQWPLKRNLQSLLSVFTAAGIAFALLLSAYYFATHNRAGSYANLYGKYLRIQHVVDSLKNDQTYFIALTADAGDDANGRQNNTKATSLVAANDTKVVMSSEFYFPDSSYSVLFSKSSLVMPGKRVIVFLDGNTKILDSLNLANRHTFGQTAYGERYLVINN